jgi:magnesium-transporting ATPase (P-type)
MILWIAFVIGIIFTVIWTWKQTTEPGKPVAKTQIMISVGAFIVLVFALGEPFAGLSWYDPGYGSLSLIFYALLVGIIRPTE